MRLIVQTYGHEEKNKKKKKRKKERKRKENEKRERVPDTSEKAEGPNRVLVAMKKSSSGDTSRRMRMFLWAIGNRLPWRAQEEEEEEEEAEEEEAEESHCILMIL